MKNVEVVYHCAATAHEGLSVFSPYEITRNNYLASVSIFSAAINEKVKRIIFVHQWLDMVIKKHLLQKI
jgi:UDP-glucose 4-epimerase